MPMHKLTKTEQKLLDTANTDINKRFYVTLVWGRKAYTGGKIRATGNRELRAAQKLVSLGLAEELKSFSGSHTARGWTTYHHEFVYKVTA